MTRGGNTMGHRKTGAFTEEDDGFRWDQYKSQRIRIERTV